MLQGRDTFQITDNPPLVVNGLHDLANCRTLPEGAAPQFVSEVLATLGQNRFTTPLVLVIVVTSAGEGFPRTAGGRHHAAHALRLEVQGPESWKEVTLADLPEVDHTVTFGSREGKVWRCSCRPGPSGMVVIRGLRFFQDGTEIFPPFTPWR